MVCVALHRRALRPLSPQLTHLKREKATLDDEMSASRLDPAEARDKLLGRVKEDNARIQVWEAQGVDA